MANPNWRDESRSRPAGPNASRWVIIALAGLTAAGLVAYFALRPRFSPPPADISHDDLLVRGREMYLARCASCHGPLGRGDGPVARSLSGPPPRDLTDSEWKHGDRPEQVLAVIARGVPQTAMAGWSSAFGNSDLKAVAAYVYYLGQRDVPRILREQ